jgi:hypothetical protein
VWQHNTAAPVATNNSQRVGAGQPHIANNDQQQPLSVPRLPDDGSSSPDGWVFLSQFLSHSSSCGGVRGLPRSGLLSTSRTPTTVAERRFAELESV